MFPTILIVDDEPSILQSLSGLLGDEGFSVLTASNGYEALKIVEAESPDLVLLDIWMPGIDGIETLQEIKKSSPIVQVVIITGHGTIETAVKATKLGAFDLIEKPLSIDRVIVTINNALNFRRLEEENQYLRKKTLEKNSIDGGSPAANDLRKQIMAVAPTDSWVLIKGENGTGKELVARTLHQLSPRAESPLVDLNCAAIPDALMEEELFGREKDALTENSPRRRGKFELAGGGTLFFDEIGDMNLTAQARILRVLQEQRFQRVGGDRVIQVDVRVIAATNKDLEKEIEAGRFREDLYYRLNVVPIRVPSLRERKEDIPVLVNAFLKESRGERNSKRMDLDALKILSDYPWPGNVRELKNLVGRMVILTDQEVIRARDLPAPYNPDAGGNGWRIEEGILSQERFETAREMFEQAFFRKKLEQFGNDIDKTAAAIGMEPEVLGDRISKLGLSISVAKGSA